MQGLPCQTPSLGTFLTLNVEEDSLISFVYPFLTANSEPLAKFFCLLGMEPGPLLDLHLHNLSVAGGFLCCVRFPLIPFHVLEA